MNKISFKKYQSGVYVLYGKGRILYIGQSDNVFLRIGQHIKANKIPFDNVDFFPLKKEYKNYIESLLIKIYLPKYNIKNGDCTELCKDKKPIQRMLALFGKSELYNYDDVLIDDVESVINWILKRR